MAKPGNLVSSRSFNPTFNPCHTTAKGKTLLFSQFHTYSINAASVTVTASTKRKDSSLHSPLIRRNTSRAARRLITISPSDGKYHGDWTSDYLVSLQDLQLQDLIEVEDDPHRDAQVVINLSIQKTWILSSGRIGTVTIESLNLPLDDSNYLSLSNLMALYWLYRYCSRRKSKAHASFGLSVDARVATSFTTKCSNCSSPYCRQIDANFNVWVLRANRDKRKMQLPEIGGDPYVIYVRPGYEVHLDSLVQDAIRLNSSVKDTCSELCEKSEGTILYTTGQSQASFDKRWSRLLELKKANL